MNSKSFLNEWLILLIFECALQVKIRSHSVKNNYKCTLKILFPS